MTLRTRTLAGGCAALALCLTGCSGGSAKPTAIPTAATTTTTPPGLGVSVASTRWDAFDDCPPAEPATTLPPVNISGTQRAAGLVPFAPEQVLICEYGSAASAPTAKARLVRSAGLLEPLVADLVQETNRLPELTRSRGADGDGSDCAVPVRSGFLDFESGTHVIDLRYVTGCHAVVSNGLRNARASTQWLQDLRRDTYGT